MLYLNWLAGFLEEYDQFCTWGLEFSQIPKHRRIGANDVVAWGFPPKWAAENLFDSQKGMVPATSNDGDISWMTYRALIMKFPQNQPEKVDGIVRPMKLVGLTPQEVLLAGQIITQVVGFTHLNIYKSNCVISPSSVEISTKWYEISSCSIVLCYFFTISIALSRILSMVKDLRYDPDQSVGSLGMDGTWLILRMSSCLFMWFWWWQTELLEMIGLCFAFQSRGDENADWSQPR